MVNPPICAFPFVFAAVGQFETAGEPEVVTFTVMLQDVAGLAIWTLAAVNTLDPAVAVIVPPVQPFTTPGVVANTRPDGNVSVKLIV